MIASIWEEGAKLYVRTPYNPDFVEAIKTRIPQGARHWDGSAKLWVCNPKYVSLVLKLCREYYPRVEIDDDLAKRATTQQGQRPGTYEFNFGSRGVQNSPYEQLLRDLPEAAMKKVYKAIAVSMHPDTGGDVELMKQVNIAWGRIRQLKGWDE